MRLKSRRVWQFSHDCEAGARDSIHGKGFRPRLNSPLSHFARESEARLIAKRDSSTDLPGSTNRRPGSPSLCPGASRKTKSSGHSARNDTECVRPPREVKGYGEPSTFAGHSMLCPFYNGVGCVKRHESCDEPAGSSGFPYQDLFCAADQSSGPRILRWFGFHQPSMRS
jgi:hypothetical protein